MAFNISFILLLLMTNVIDVTWTRMGRPHNDSLAAGLGQIPRCVTRKSLQIGKQCVEGRCIYYNRWVVKKRCASSF